MKKKVNKRESETLTGMIGSKTSNRANEAKNVSVERYMKLGKSNRTNMSNFGNRGRYQLSNDLPLSEEEVAFAQQKHGLSMSPFAATMAN